MPLHLRLVTALVLGLGFAAATAAPAARPAPCRLPGISTQVICGSLQRPLDPEKPAHAVIDIHYLIVPALARNKLPDPVVLLAGGPGQSAISLASAVLPLLGRLNNRRDLIFIDQRGTGRSAPLNCEPTDDNKGLADRFDPELQRRMLAQCRARLGRLPYLRSEQDLRFFTTTIAMNDVDALRRQLGIDKLNLIGVSYGSRAALEMLRLFPKSVRRSVLDGVAPPDMALPASMSIDSQQALDSVFAACASESKCAAAFPRLRADWQKLLDSLPRTVDMRDPRSGRIDKLDMNRDMLLGLVRTPLYLPVAASALPAAINAAADGRFEPLAALASWLQPPPGRDKQPPIAQGMHFSVICSEDVPRLDGFSDAAGSDFGESMRQLYQRICSEWPRAAIAPDFYRIGATESAVLMFSGGLDPATPPRHAAAVAARLGARSSLRVVPNAGHGLLATGCVRDLIFRFIDAADDDAALAVDSRCVESIPRPPAFVPPELQAPPG